MDTLRGMPVYSNFLIVIFSIVLIHFIVLCKNKKKEVIQYWKP